MSFNRMARVRRGTPPRAEATGKSDPVMPTAFPVWVTVSLTQFGPGGFGRDKKKKTVFIGKNTQRIYEKSRSIGQMNPNCFRYYQNS